MPERAVTLLACACLMWIASACARDDEAAMRTRLVRWFSLGDTVVFKAGPDCAAAVFRVVDTRIKSSMRVTDGVSLALYAWRERSAVAVDNRALSPDRVIVQVADARRDLGMRMRRAALESRGCMGEGAEDAFRAALMAPGAVLAWDEDSAALMLLDTRTKLLIVAMGSH